MNQIQLRNDGYGEGGLHIFEYRSNTNSCELFLRNRMHTISLDNIKMTDTVTKARRDGRRLGGRKRENTKGSLFTGVSLYFAKPKPVS